MKLLLETENQPTNILFDKNDTIDFKINKNLCTTKYNIKLYNVNELDKDLILTFYGTYFDINFILENDLNLYKILNKKIKSSILLENLLDHFGEVRGEYLSTQHNLYYIDKIKIEEKYKLENYNILILKNLRNILMYKDKKMIGNIVIKAELDYEVNKDSIIESYKYEDDFNKLIESYQSCGFERIKNTEYLILVND